MDPNSQSTNGVATVQAKDNPDNLLLRTPLDPEKPPEEEKPLSVDTSALRTSIENGFKQDSDFDSTQPSQFTPDQGIEVPAPDDEALDPSQEDTW